MDTGTINRSERLALVPDVIVDPAPRLHAPGQWLLIEGPKIAGIGAGALPDGVRPVPLPGRVVMPAFVDSHAHLAFRYADGPIGPQLAQPREIQLGVGRANLAARLAQGITSIRDLSELDFLDRELAEDQRAGRIPGPAIVSAGRGIRAPDGHGYCGTPASGPSEIRRLIKENHAAGASWTKVYVTGSPFGSGDRLGHSFLTQEEIKAAVDESHRRGLPVAAHAFGGAGMTLALTAGVDSIEHGLLADEVQARAMADRGTWLSTTYANVVGPGTPLAAGPVLDELQEKAQASFSRMAEAGVRFAAGTDDGPGGIDRELAALVALGMSSWAALEAATAGGANLLGLSHEVGGLRVGMQADLVILEGDPTIDLSATARVRAVMQGGRWYPLSPASP